MAEKGAIARPYAQAVFELAHESGQLRPWSDLLQAAAATVSNEDVARIIHDPATDEDALLGLIVDISIKAAVQADVAQARNFLRLLAANDRLPLLPEIAEQFDVLKADAENRIDVTLTAASAVDQAQQDRIAAALKQRLGREVNLNFELDEKLIGGARLQADDLVIDGSVRAGLAKLASALMN